MRRLLVVLVTAASGLAAGGCLLAEETVEPSGTVTVQKSAGCPPRATAGRPSRLYRFITRHPYSAGPGAGRSYVRRTIPTRVQEGPRGGAPLLWRFAQLGAYLVGALFLALVLSILLGHWAPRRLGRIRGALLAAAALLISVVAAGVAGHAAGSEFVIDNGLDRDVEIRIGGRSAGILRGRHFFTRRIGGGEIVLAVHNGDQVVESIRLRPDSQPGQAVVRALFGRGWYLYSICGRNQYRLDR